MYFFITTLFLFGIGLTISGSQKLTEQVRTAMSPNDIELIQEELKNRKQVGQLLLVVFGFIIILLIT